MAFPRLTLDTTPPTDPASSPVLELKFEPLSMMPSPSALTVVLVSDASDDLATFGYGIGTGPAGDGVLHTSGNAMDMPLLFLCTTVHGWSAPTVTDISLPISSVESIRRELGSVRTSDLTRTLPESVLSRRSST